MKLSNLKDNMLVFGKVCFPQMFTVQSAKFHYQIIRHLHDQSFRKLNIIAPRGHGKSSLIAGVFPLYHLFFDKGPKFIVIVSKTEGHAVRLLDTIKDALDHSHALRLYFGYHGMFVSRIWKNNEIGLDTGDMIMARGTGQQVVGLKYLNQRPTLIIVDDPEDMNNTKTDEAMEFNFRWLMQSLIPSLDPQRGRVVVVGTPQHQRCIVETLKGASGWTTLHYKSIQDDKTVLWPEWISQERLEEIRAEAESVGRISMFYREYQCQVMGDDEQLFKEGYLHTWDGTVTHNKDGEAFVHLNRLDDNWYQTPRQIPVNIFMGIDPASSVSKNADYSAIVPVAMDAEYNRYVLPYFRERVTPMDLADRAIEYYKIYKPSRTRIESVGYQEMLREYLRQKLYIPGLELKESPRTAKSARLESMHPFFASHKMHLKQDMNALKEELLLYPRGAHDDLLDALFYAMKGIYTPYHNVEPRRELSDHLKYFVGLAEDEDIQAKYERIMEEDQRLGRIPLTQAI